MKIMPLITFLTSIALSFALGSYYHYLLPLHKTPSSAIAIMQPTKGNKTSGVVEFTQEKNGIRIVANITGLTPGKHGFHVHEYGDCNCDNGICTGDHFNPTNAPHGAPTDSNVHVGDFGNLEANNDGHAHYDKLNKHIAFFGPCSIIGRGLIIHQDPDDLKSQPTGNSGTRIACGVIGVGKE